jgi:phosphatidylglycerophosphate synthase
VTPGLTLPSDSDMERAPREAWILATGTHPALLANVCGIPHLLRLACDLALAGARSIYVVVGSEPTSGVASIANDPRLAARASLYVVTSPPPGDLREPVFVVRSDRVFHRDLPGAVAAAWRARGDARLAKVAGAEHDAIAVADRTTAERLVAAWSDELAELARAGAIVEAAPPYMAFTAAPRDARTLRAAERRLVRSLRKSADGIMAKALNRRLSLPLTGLLCRTRVHPNHVTLFALACALAGGFVLARPGYLAAVVGMLLVELGSIVDGIDGELARLRFQFSRAGQWLDTVVDDVANVAYITGVTVHLSNGGVAWALPIGVAALVAFVLTQGTQYLLITYVYRSGDLAAIPWAFQSTTFLSQRPTGLRAWIAATVPKMLKRDFVVTAFVVCALLGRLDIILAVFATGAFVFFGVLFVQLFRNLGEIRAHRAAQSR